MQVHVLNEVMRVLSLKGVAALHLLVTRNNGEGGHMTWKANEVLPRASKLLPTRKLQDFTRAPSTDAICSRLHRFHIRVCLLVSTFLVITNYSHLLHHNRLETL